MAIIPDAHVSGSDASLGCHRRWLNKDEARAANRAAAEVNQMPIVGHTIHGRVLAHGRNHDAILESHATDRERLKKVDSRHAGLSSTVTYLCGSRLQSARRAATTDAAADRW